MAVDPKYLDITDFYELLIALNRIPGVAMPLLERAMDQSVKVVVGIVKEYPPATAANAPGRVRTVRRGDVMREEPLGYYERHRGWWYPIKRVKTLGPKPKKTAGAIRTRKISGVVGFKLSAGGRSEFLGQGWTTEVRRAEGGVEGVIGNNTSYALPVQGPYPKVQSEYMHAIGWTSIDAGLEEAQPAINAAFEEATEALLKSIGVSARYYQAR